MKKLILLMLVCLYGITLYAQETFFALKPGTVVVYKIFDKKGKEKSGMKYTIKNVKGTQDNLTITYNYEVSDAKGKPVYNEDITIFQKGDKIYFDMNNLVNKSAYQKNGQIPAEVVITGNSMEIPVNPVPGSSLPDANVSMEMKMGVVNMKMSATVTNRKVEGWENVSVKAGNYKACKFSGDINAIIIGLNVKSKSTDWYAKGVGIVKSEIYNKKGELESIRELVEFKQ